MLLHRLATARRAAVPGAIAVLSLLAACAPAHADLFGEINQIRAAGCGGKPGLKQPFIASRKLDDVAKHLLRGTALRDALAALDYRAIKSNSIQMKGWLTAASIARNLDKQFCPLLLDPGLREIGIARDGSELRLVLARPFATPALTDPVAVSRRVLKLTNLARARGQRCGDRHYDAAQPLSLSDSLHEAALAHSRDMARRDYFEHEAPDGTKPAERVTRQGYPWRVVGENLAAGALTPEEAVQGWLDSPHHCANLMDPRFVQMGVAYAIDATSSSAIYWTQVFAVPRD